MRELRDLVAAWSGLDPAREAAVLATVVATAGSSYRRPGARLLLSAERRMAGSVSGGCLERDLVSRAWWRTREGPVVVTYDSRSADDEETWTFGLGCQGRVDVLLERLAPEGPVHPLAFLNSVLTARRPGLMATVVQAGGAGAAVGQRLLLDDSGVRTDLPSGDLARRIEERARSVLSEGRTQTETVTTLADPVDVLLEVLRPPRSLVLFGSGQDVIPLVRLAALLGFHVTVVSNAPAGTAADSLQPADLVVQASPASVRDRLQLEPDAAAVVMTHNLSHDAGYLRVALASGCPYVGVLGPRARTERLIEMLRTAGHAVSEAERQRIFSPVGLHLGAEQPEEIALSILAEVQAVFTRTEPRSLRFHPGPIHDVR